MKAQEIIIKQILDGLEQGEIPRQKTRVSRWPINMISKKQYRWFNSMLLQWKAGKNNWSKYRLTAKQAKDLGGRIVYEERKKWTAVVFYTMLESEKENDKGKKDTFPLLRFYTVYNRSQTEWIPKPIEDTIDNEKLSEAEAVIQEYVDREEIGLKWWEPAYNWAEDFIRMPGIVEFTTSDEYYQAFYHEITHSTGAEKRLDRKIKNQFGDGDYSKEELVAEVGATILMNETGLKRNIKNTQAYINWWTRYIQDKPGEVIQAFTKAMKACEFILDINQDTNEIKE